MLKYKYFIHHYLSIVIFCLCGVGGEFIVGFLSEEVPEFWYAFLIYLGIYLVENVYYCYIKYMIDIHYHYYWNIMFSVGILLTSINAITIFTYIIIGKNTSLPEFIQNFLDYFNKVPPVNIIFKFIINFVLQFISSVLEILTIFYLSPEYIIISQNFSYFFNFVLLEFVINKLTIVNYYKYSFIALFILQIFFLSIYLEIFELNFCKLNKNTRRNIKSRINDDLIERKDSYNDNYFQEKDNYIFRIIDDNSHDNDNLNIELNIIEDE